MMVMAPLILAHWRRRAATKLVLLLLVVACCRLESVDAFGSSAMTPSTAPVLPARENAVGDRRDFLTSFLSTVGALALWANGGPQPSRRANAEYGASAKQELPNYIEFLIEKNAVADPDSFLYKGPDPQVQLKRLLEASKRLDDIPALAADKKWSQVQGILTGPLGTLAQTLNLIAKDSSPQVQAKAKKVKDIIFSISTAATKKNEAEVVANTRAASVELEAFVRAAFQGS